MRINEVGVVSGSRSACTKMTGRDVMPHSMWHPCGSTKPVMDPRVALRLPEDDRGRCHAALDAASMRISEASDGSPGRAPLTRG
ncbi:hypothetical protein OO006_11225 [Prosthecochloris sp. SCSIO W1101]|uniref:hypothetical protein n=1 Tax=Prosthecochloris sp. SCSIO W1101 TaxID=2992242 RepID=UPI00223DD63B|nr:hypothetical protein [Prosthecochloris sp. SCSIO W1101]UZJ40914.1 hypothetical protein OO006_11225 [Prosthecochloris sp. SCSIO W1101]